MADNKKTVLVVEDDNTFRELLIDALEREGVETLEAKNGDEALDVAIRNHPDAIILDLIMPTSQGNEVLKKIRADDWGSGVPIIVLTQVEDISSVATATSSGATAYLVKSETTADDAVSEVSKHL